MTAPPSYLTKRLLNPALFGIALGLTFVSLIIVTIHSIFGFNSMFLYVALAPAWPVAGVLSLFGLMGPTYTRRADFIQLVTFDLLGWYAVLLTIDGLRLYFRRHP